MGEAKYVNMNTVTLPTAHYCIVYKFSFFMEMVDDNFVDLKRN